MIQKFVMVVPSSNINYPLAILAIFLRRVVDKLRKVPKGTLLIKSQNRWYDVFPSQEQWPLMMASLVLTYIFSHFYKKESPFLVKVAKHKAMLAAVNNGFKKKRRLWITKNFNERRGKDAKTRLTTSFRDGNFFSSYHSRLKKPNFITSTNNTLGTEKETNKSCSMDKEESCTSRVETTVGNNDSSTFKISERNGNTSQIYLSNKDMNPQSLNISQYLKQADSSIQQPTLDDIQNEILEMKEKEENMKFLDPMCEMLPIMEADEENRSSKDGRNLAEYNLSGRRRKGAKRRFAIRKSKLKNIMNFGRSYLIKHPHVMRMTRSGKVYGY